MNTSTNSLAASLDHRTSNSAPEGSEFCWTMSNNIWINQILDDWQTPIENRLEELKTQRKAQIRANLPTRDITAAIHKLSRICVPQQLILAQRPYQMFVTLNCSRNYPDHMIVNSLEKVLRRVNDNLRGKRWQKRGLGLHGPMVLERKSKPVEREAKEQIVKDVLPHIHMLLKSADAGDLFDRGEVEHAFEYSSQSRVNLVETSERDEAGLLLRDQHGDILKVRMFDPWDFDVRESLTRFDDENLARYMTKNLFREKNTHEQWGVGLYHFNRDGLVKVF
jgi:hypothetical protein